MAPAAVTRLAVFAYGSLVAPASAALTLGRPVELAGPATLRGWARGWTVCRDNLTSEKTFARADGSLPRFCLGLGVEPVAGATASAGAPGAGPAGAPAAGDVPAPNGALIEVAEAELERLGVRELRYHQVEVTDAVAVAPSAGRGVAFDRVFVYRPRREHLHPTPPADSIVVAAYARAVEGAFAALGAEHLDRFHATTAAPPVEVCEAHLVGDRIPAGNPRAW
ncbi:MAG: hypothetical protein GEU88_04635 [Solirubrobacterales bacterium]|nr:hypothetical protein [Solirubrobacterales bacterium]